LVWTREARTEKEWKQFYPPIPKMKDFLRRSFSVGLKCDSKSRAVSRGREEGAGQGKTA